jgi:hypothetical protein
VGRACAVLLLCGLFHLPVLIHATVGPRESHFGYDDALVLVALHSCVERLQDRDSLAEGSCVSFHGQRIPLIPCDAPTVVEWEKQSIS